ncbi:hypothetical protein G3A43_06700 [Paraburkholderia aspalathi]|nr:hypothetical protein [Paraburkholderia aspalathi]MBK3779939.1 hypothetical protein [Paraburkholderia aspalathi]
MPKHRLTLKHIAACVALSFATQAHADLLKEIHRVQDSIQRGLDQAEIDKQNGFAALNHTVKPAADTFCNVGTAGGYSSGNASCGISTGPSAAGGSYDGQKAEFKSGVDGSAGEPQQVSIQTTVTAIGGPTVGDTQARVASDSPSYARYDYFVQFAGRSPTVVSNQSSNTPVRSKVADRPQSVEALWEDPNETLRRTSAEAFCSAVVDYLYPKSNRGTLLGGVMSIWDLNAAVVSTTRNPSPAEINKLLVQGIETSMDSFAGMAMLGYTGGPLFGIFVSGSLALMAHYGSPPLAKLITGPVGTPAPLSPRQAPAPKVPPEPPTVSAGTAPLRVIPLEKRLPPRED